MELKNLQEILDKTAGFWTKIWDQKLLNMKQQCSPLKSDS